MATKTKKKSSGKWMQKVSAATKRRGTKGKCTGKNFGGPGCRKGTPQYNAAVGFRAAAKRRRKKK